MKIRGVISFTFQMAVKRCVVRIRSDLKAEVSYPLHNVIPRHWEMDEAHPFFHYFVIL